MDEPQGDDASRGTSERTRSEEVVPPSTAGRGHAPSGYSSTGHSASGRRYEREPRVENLIDGVMGGSSSTTVDRPEVHTPSSARTPMAWPPRPPVTPPPLFPSSAPTSAPAPTAPHIAAPQPAASTRVGERLHRPGHWTHRGLRPRWHVVLAIVVAGAMIAAALFTTRSLETSASTNFPGVVSSASPEYFNFVGQAPLTSVDVSPGETVVAGQILATQDNTVQAAAVVKDNMLLASDEQALAALLGQSGQLAATEAAALLTKASSVSLADEQRGSSSVAEGEGQVAAAEAQLTTDQGQLAADQAAYRSQCPAGVGRGCQSLSRDIAFDQSAVAQATTHVGVAQQGLNRDQGLEGTLLKLAQQVQQEASAATPNVLPAVIQGIRQAREAVANDVYQLAVDQGNLAATELVAPFPGRVIGVYATDGEIVGSAGTRQGSSSQSPVVPGASASNVLAPSSPSNSSAASQPFISINATTMDAVAQVPEAQVSAVRVGEAATVTVNALSGSSAILHAKVSSIGLQPVQVNGAVFYDVTVVPSIGTWPSTVLSGMTANIAIP